MAAPPDRGVDGALMQDFPAKTKRALALTRLGLVAERIVHAFFPLWSVGFLVIGATLLGLPAQLSFEALWFGIVAVAVATLWCVWLGLRRFQWPTRDDALARLDATLPGRPLAALADDQAIGDGDPGSQAVWKAHRARMAERAAAAKAAQPELSVAPRDPYALRYAALLVLAIGVTFGSLLRVADVGLTNGDGAAAAGPTWEGWIEPPSYTGQPALYLADQKQTLLAVPEGSRVTIRLYGEIGALTVAETVSGRTGEVPAASEPVQSFDITRDGALTIDGPGGRTWQIDSITDGAPEVQLSVTLEQLDREEELTNDLQQLFEARDDYGVVSGTATIELDLARVDRRYGLAAEPDTRDVIELSLPMTISGNRADFSETLIENFDRHPWAHLPVRLSLKVVDDQGQEGVSTVKEMALPARRFFDPMAQAVIEQRQALLWSRSNARQVAQLLRAISHYPDDIFRSDTSYLRLSFTLRRLETFAEYGLNDAQQEEIAQALWDLAIQLEDGDLADAEERLARAQERLQEAIENGASDEEIAELMQELREAMQDYMRQLAETQPQQDQQPGQQQAQNGQEVTQDQLSQMLEELQRLMEEGRSAEAQALLDQLRQMMENMQVTQGQQGQGQQSPGQQAMEGLAETLREQQGLSDEAFRDLQEQFNPDAQAGESQQNQGRDGGQGRGEQHSQQQGQGQGQGQEGQQGQQGENQAQNGQGGQGGEQSLEDSLANRQQALRQELQRQRDGLPGAGTQEGEAARDALDRAGRAMDEAEDALRQDDLAEAIDNQSEALDALRDGMQALGEAMAQQQQQQGQNSQGEQFGNAQPMNRDPFGRDPTGQGATGTGENLLQGEDVYRRAQELLDEIRRRSADQDRPDVELDYLRRLLDRF